MKWTKPDSENLIDWIGVITIIALVIFGFKLFK